MLFGPSLAMEVRYTGIFYVLTGAFKLYILKYLGRGLQESKVIPLTEGLRKWSMPCEFDSHWCSMCI